MRCWDFKRWTSHVLYSICSWLSVRAVRYCSHRARSCVVIHIWVGKTCGMLFDRSRDAWSESRDMIGVVTSTESRSAIRIGIYDQSHIFRPESGIRPESRLSARVGHTIGVASSDRSRAYDQSRAYDRSRVFRLETGIWPESWNTCIISMYNCSIRYENLFITLNMIKRLADFLLWVICRIIHSVGPDCSRQE
jgi:hypothetical protein